MVLRFSGADLPFKEAPTPEFRDQWKLETEMAMEPFLLENTWRRSIRLFLSLFLLERLDKVNVRDPPSGGRLWIIAGTTRVTVGQEVLLHLCSVRGLNWPYVSHQSEGRHTSLHDPG